jgi:hypothetical protein
MLTNYDLELPILRGALWKNAPGAVVGGLIGAAIGGAFAASVSGAYCAFWIALGAGWVSAYGWAIIEESLSTAGERVFPRLHEAWVWLEWQAFGLLGAWRRTWRQARVALDDLRWSTDGDRAGTLA